MTDEQFKQLVELLQAIRNGIDTLVVAEMSNQATTKQLTSLLGEDKPQKDPTANFFNQRLMRQALGDEE